VTSDLKHFADCAQISELLSRYCSFIDDKCITVENVASVFTPDGRYVAPNDSAVVGPEAIAIDKIKVFSRFRATHHVTSDHVIDVEGDTASLRANMTAMHLWSDELSDPTQLESHFVAGGVFNAIAVRTSEGWRFSQLSARVVWRSGAGLSMMAKLGK
jgi:hypothetical protein